MPTPYADGVHHTQNVRQFADDLRAATGGEPNIVVHSGASLIKHPEIHRAVRTGQVPIGEMFMGLLGNDNPIFKADNIPFLASDFDSAKKLWDASRPYIEKALQKDGLKLLYAVPWPPQGFYTKKPIDSAADLEGLKMRAYSPTTSRLAVLLKATPTTVLTTSIILPMIERSGIDLLWFGIYVVLVVEMSQITPPVGFNLFVIQGLTKIDIIRIARYALPFFLLLMTAIVLLTAFPGIATWLPARMTS